MAQTHRLLITAAVMASLFRRHAAVATCRMSTSGGACGSARPLSFVAITQHRRTNHRAATRSGSTTPPFHVRQNKLRAFHLLATGSFGSYTNNLCGGFVSSTSLSFASNNDSSCQDGRSSDESNTSDDFAPTWIYTPYQPTGRGGGRGGRGGGRGGRGGQQQRRPYSNGRNDNWKVPDRIAIPEDRLDVSFVRSSGSGGQNVNKLSTKVEVRFHLEDADWIPGEVRNRIKQNFASRINKEGELSVTSQEYRTQGQNRKDAMKKLEGIILAAYPRPKVRKMRTGVSKKAKQRMKEDKKRNAQKKANRKSVDY